LGHVIPIYFGDLNEPLQIERVSACFIQIKNRQRGVPWSLGEECGEVFDTPGHHITTARLDLGDNMDKVEVLKCRWPSKGIVRSSFMLGVWKRGTKFPALAGDRFEVGQAFLSRLQGHLRRQQRNL
jgi:hypothetical protein